MTIPEADEVVIQLDRLNWGVFDSSYRNWWDATPGKLSEDWAKKKEKILTSIARRVKYEALMGSVVAKDHIGVFSPEAVYGTIYFANVGYEVLSTKPEGEVRVTEKTKLTVKSE